MKVAYKKVFFVFLSIIFIVGIIHFKSTILYKSAIGYCKTQKLNATSEFLLCQYNFMAKFDKNLAEKYLKIRDECLYITENQFDLSNCADEKMTELKYVKIK